MGDGSGAAGASGGQAEAATSAPTETGASADSPSTAQYEADLLAAGAAEHVPEVRASEGGEGAVEAAEQAGDADGTDVDESEYEEEDDEGEALEEETVVVVRRSVFVAVATVALLVILGLAGGLAYELTKKPASVATVNGSTISRNSYDQAVARDNGPTVLNDMVINRLVQQDAAKRHITVTTDEVDAKLKQTKAQFGSDAEYQQALQQNHLTELQLRDRIRTNLMLQKLTADKVQVSEQEIEQEYNQGKDTTYQGKTLDDVKSQIQQSLTQQKQQDATQAYLEQLCSSAKITTHVPGGDVGHGCSATG